MTMTSASMTEPKTNEAAKWKEVTLAKTADVDMCVAQPSPINSIKQTNFFRSLVSTALI